MIYETYGFLHKMAKKILHKNVNMTKNYYLVNFKDDFFVDDELQIPSNYKGYINDINVSGERKIYKSDVYPIENLVERNYPNPTLTFCRIKKGEKTSNNLQGDVEELWKKFIKNSCIDKGYKYGQCHYAGFIKEKNQWCLPSWIWTNAAIVRYFCKYKELEEAIKLGDLILAQQHECGGWVVRNDYTSNGLIPELAPNDSAYIANNCCLELYFSTGLEKYIDAAKKTANWIIATARDDGLVHIGYNMLTNSWIKDKNIVDIGFTAALFARLYNITHEEKYIIFLQKFINKYIDVFYDDKEKCFVTAVDEANKKKGGNFGRGQAWALEGLIPAFEVLNTKKIKGVIDNTINTLLEKQNRHGGWCYNLANPLMGIDCKATPLIAKSILLWSKQTEDNCLIKSVEKAISWCEKHTERVGIAVGGIFSYTIEGAIAHNLYTNTAFVYSSCYALEVKKMLEEIANA